MGRPDTIVNQVVTGDRLDTIRYDTIYDTLLMRYDGDPQCNATQTRLAFRKVGWWHTCGEDARRMHSHSHSGTDSLELATNVLQEAQEFNSLE